LKFIDSDVPAPGDVRAQLPYRNVSSVFKFIDEQKSSEKPFFAWVSIAEPHNPYQVPAPYFDMFPPNEIPPTIAGPEALERKGERFVWVRSIWEKVLGDAIDQRIARARSNYFGMLRLIDDQFKRLIEGLEQRKIIDNTIIIFLSDHGDFVGEYGLMRKGPDLPNLLTRIPMIWKGPGIKAQGRRDGVFVNIVDIFPSLCDLLDVERPFGVQGKSIKPLLANTDFDEREFNTAYSESGFSGLYWNDRDHLSVQEEGACYKWETFDCLNTWTQAGQVRMIRKGSFKLQLDMMGTGYLYNVEVDPMELENLFDDEAFISIKADLLSELSATMMRVTDLLPTPRSRYRTKIHPKGYWFDDGFVMDDPGVKHIGASPKQYK
jgi:arylsulfatase A-like enzyme